jgi:hypothetical protein
MPIDYSKWDALSDGDEDDPPASPPPPPPSSAAAAARTCAPAPGSTSAGCMAEEETANDGSRSTYEGPRNAKRERHGEGTWKHDDGRQYVGGFRNDRRHGHGTMTYADGSVYQGGYRDGLRHGEGSYTAGNGSRLRYHGGWEDGLMHGTGRLELDGSSSTATLYVGDLASGKMSGYGRLESGDQIYEGQHVDGRRHGQGILTMVSTGEVMYSGEWRDGKMASINTYRLRRVYRTLCWRYCYWMPLVCGAAAAAVVLLAPAPPT